MIGSRMMCASAIDAPGGRALRASVTAAAWRIFGLKPPASQNIRTATIATNKAAPKIGRPCRTRSPGLKRMIPPFETAPFNASRNRRLRAAAGILETQLAEDHFRRAESRKTRLEQVCPHEYRQQQPPWAHPVDQSHACQNQ